MTLEIRELLEKIDQRLAVAQGEIAQLEAAKSMLSDSSAPPARRASGPPRARRARPVAKTRRGTELEVGVAEALLAQSPRGETARSLAHQAGSAYGVMLARLRELELHGVVVRERDGRSQRWRLITDEERLAERTAELERASRSHRLNARRRA